MNRNSPNRTAREQWKQRYISALISALGAATILHLDGACKTLHALSYDAMGLTSPEKSDTMGTGETPGMIGTEVNTMKYTNFWKVLYNPTGAGAVPYYFASREEAEKFSARDYADAPERVKAQDGETPILIYKTAEAAEKDNGHFEYI